MLPNVVPPTLRHVLTLLRCVASSDGACNGSPSDSLMCCRSTATVRSVVDVRNCCWSAAKVPVSKMPILQLRRPVLKWRLRRRLRPHLRRQLQLRLVLVVVVVKRVFVNVVVFRWRAVALMYPQDNRRCCFM